MGTAFLTIFVLPLLYLKVNLSHTALIGAKLFILFSIQLPFLSPGLFNDGL